MENHSSEINFVIWGVRNGFEVILASKQSDVEHLKADVISDRMRQVCNLSPKRFFSIHRTSRFAAASIYHTETRDIVGRNAYIAVTLYIPLSSQFVGNVIGTLNSLMDFYLLTQEGASVNMFTEEMIRERCKGLASDAFTGNLSFGSKSGYLSFEIESDIKERFEQLNIDGYKAVFFIPPANQEATRQLIGYELVSSFTLTHRIVLDPFDPSQFTVLYNNKKLVQGPGSLTIDGLPGELIIITEIATGRSKKIYFQPSPQTHVVSQLFPRIMPNPGVNPGNGGSGGFSKYKALVVVFIVVAIVLGILGYVYFGDEDGKNFQTEENYVNHDASDASETGKSTKELFDIQNLTSVDSLNILTKGRTISGIKKMRISAARDSVFFIIDKEFDDSISKIESKLLDILTPLKPKPVQSKNQKKNQSIPPSNQKKTRPRI
jgi:hypothetical protein